MSAPQRWTLVAVVIGSGMVFLDGTVVNVALPRIGAELPSREFGVLEAQSYVYNAYLLALSALLIPAGALNDAYGRRRMFAAGLAGFGATSLLCGLAPTMELLIVARVAQGAAGAILVPGSLSIIAAGFEGEAKGKAFGVWAGASTLVTILGPVLGGVLVDTASWRAAFIINVPLAVLAVAVTLRWVPESKDEAADRRLDWLGAAVAAVAMGGLVLGAVRGQQLQWQDPVGWAALAVGAAAAAAAPFVMLRSPNPLVPPELFRSRNFTVTNISTLFIYGALYVVLYLLGIFLQGTLGYTATAAGVAIVPGILFLALFSQWFGALAGRHGPRWFMAAGPAVMGIGVLWLARVPASSAAWVLRASEPASFAPPAAYLSDVLPGMLLFGVGAMVMVAPLTTALMTSVPVERSGVASAFNNAVSRVGPQLAGALIFVAVTASFYGTLGTLEEGLDVTSPAVRAALAPLNAPDPSLPAGQAEAARAASTAALHLGMVISAGLLFVGAAVNAVGICDRDRRLEGGTETLSGEVTERLMTC
ncbi:MAG: MFS transporter [Acidimicrobiia bacterium]